MSTEMSPCVILSSVVSCVSARHYSNDLKPKLVSISVTLDMLRNLHNVYLAVLRCTISTL